MEIINAAFLVFIKKTAVILTVFQ